MVSKMNDAHIERMQLKYLVGYTCVIGLSARSELTNTLTLVGTFFSTLAVLSIIYEIWIILLKKLWVPFVETERVARFINSKDETSSNFLLGILIMIGFPLGGLGCLIFLFAQLPHIDAILAPIMHDLF